MSMLLVHELHEARDRVLLLIQKLRDARDRELPAYRPFLNEQISQLEQALEEAHIPEHYRVAVVGRFKVGKSRFVNELAQEPLAAVKTSPETAAISVFRYAEQARAEVELISAETWENLRAAHSDNPEDNEVRRYAGFSLFNQRATSTGERTVTGNPREIVDLDALAAKWIKPNGHVHTIDIANWGTPAGRSAFKREIQKFTSSQEPLHYLVNKLTIYAPIPLLRDHIELIDTPGLDDTERYRVLLTEELVRDVDAILYLTTSGASYSQSDKEFLIRQLRRRQIKHLQIIVTKGDETFENRVNDAKDNGEEPPTYEVYGDEERRRIRGEINATLNELLNHNQLSEEDGYYFIEQLDQVPIHLISAKFHKDGQREQGGIDAVRDGLYRVLSTSHRFEHSKRTLTDRLESCLGRLRDHFSARLNAIEAEYDPKKVKEEIVVIRNSLGEHLDFFAHEAESLVGLLGQQQSVFSTTLPIYLENVRLLAGDALGEKEKNDLIKHWKTRRVGNWGYLADLQAQVADKVFPVVESRLNELRGQLDEFMRLLRDRLETFQTRIHKLEEDRQLSGLEPLALAGIQQPVFDELAKRFASLREGERDRIISHLEDFMTAEVADRLDRARSRVTTVLGAGTTRRQADEVQTFYGEVKTLLGKALAEHLSKTIKKFAQAIIKSAQSVAPHLREATLSLIEARLQAIESTLALVTGEEKMRVLAYLQEMRGLSNNFAAEPTAIAVDPHTFNNEPSPLNGAEGAPNPILLPTRYEIPEDATGYTYERIFRPYLDDAETVTVEDPYVRRSYQVENFARFCALAVRLGTVKTIRLVTGTAFGEDLDEADSRLETLRRGLKSRDITLSWNRDQNLHDREVSLSNGWIIKIGRGLDIYHPPEQWGTVEAADFSLRKCKQTRIEVLQQKQ